MRIAIVNDMLIALEAMRRIVISVPGYQVAWVARTGQEAVDRCAVDRPDVILMDLFMPVMDGAEATRRIMKHTPCIILVVTATVAGNFEKVYEAMSCGALDAVDTPVLGTRGQLSGAEALIRKIATVGLLIRDSSKYGTPKEPAAVPAPAGGPSGFPLLLLGASTGGPQALAEVLAKLPKEFPAAILVVQHVDYRFAQGLASWLNERAAFPVEMAVPGAQIKPGGAWLAATNDHAILNPDHTITYTPHPRDYPYRPSVDVLFKSVAAHWKGPGCAALLTGMGRDGAEGLLILRRTGFYTIAQDQKTSVVHGMPRAAAELNAAQDILPIDQIGGRILAFFQQPRVPSSSYEPTRS